MVPNIAMGPAPAMARETPDRLRGGVPHTDDCRAHRLRDGGASRDPHGPGSNTPAGLSHLVLD